MASTKSKTLTKSKSRSLAQGQNSAVINPYALAELIAGRRISWKELSDAPRVLEQLLATPYEELFDPKYGGPLYIGHRLDDHLRLVRERSPLLDIAAPAKGNDMQLGGLADLSQYATLRDVLEHGDLKALLDWPILCFDVSRLSRLEVSLRLPDALRNVQLGRAFPASILKAITFDPKIVIKIDFGWTPPGAHWATAGTFFHETAEFFDPVQGAVANCYYIAALSAIAWATPFRISHLTRATGPNQEQFNDMIRFYKPDSGGAIDQEIQMTEAVPLTMSGDFIYCRSSEAGETWPAVYEKGFAKLKTGTVTDMPDITQTGGATVSMQPRNSTAGRAIITTRPAAAPTICGTFYDRTAFRTARSIR